MYTTKLGSVTMGSTYMLNEYILGFKQTDYPNLIGAYCNIILNYWASWVRVDPLVLYCGVKISFIRVLGCPPGAIKWEKHLLSNIKGLCFMSQKTLLLYYLCLVKCIMLVFPHEGNECLAAQFA